MNRFIYSTLVSIAMLTACQVLEVDEPSAKERNREISDSVSLNLHFKPEYAGEDSLINLFLKRNSLPHSAVVGYHPRVSNITSFDLQVDSLTRDKIEFPLEFAERKWTYVQIRCMNRGKCLIDSLYGLEHLNGLLSLVVKELSIVFFPNSVFQLENLADIKIDCGGDMEQPMDLIQQMNKKRKSLNYMGFSRCGWTTLPEDLHKLDPTISLRLSGNEICEPRPEWLQSWIIERSEVRGGSKLYFEPQYCNGELD